MSLWRLSEPIIFLVEYCVGGNGVCFVLLELVKAGYVSGTTNNGRGHYYGQNKVEEVLIDDHEVTGRQLNKIAGGKENIELDDM